jgi:phosphoribosylamine--glycine ligase/phosphoribosylformylglycinamidine cyclo-ligase
LIGGETAEMPGMYHADDYDLAGFAVGAVERELLLPTPDICAGDVLIALPSSGAHSNGFSLIRKIVSLSGLSLSSPSPWSSGQTLGEALLTPTKIYIKQLLPGIRASLFKGMSHITGGGFTENIPRIFEKESNLGVTLDLNTWELPAMWKWLMKTGNVAPTEMARTFNCGVGMVIVVAADKAQEALDSVRQQGEEAFVMGKVEQGAGVRYVGMEKWEL